MPNVIDPLWIWSCLIFLNRIELSSAQEVLAKHVKYILIGAIATIGIFGLGKQWQDFNSKNSVALDHD